MPKPNKPSTRELQEAKATLKRWYLQAGKRGKSQAQSETKKIYDILDWVESNVNLDIN